VNNLRLILTGFKYNSRKVSKMDTILITGADGFFASRFIDYYRDQYRIIGLNHGNLDITNENETMATVQKYNPAYVVHAAALSDTGMCERNPDRSFQVNVKGSINVARACSVSESKLVYLSSDQVYNGTTGAGPYSEAMAVPNTVYGNHKMEAENRILEITPRAVVLRLTWLFGLPERLKKTNSNIIWNVVKSALKNEPLKLPVHEYRGITYIYDLLENFEQMLHLPGGIYNTGSENNVSTYETAETVLKEMDLNYRIQELLIKDLEKFKDRNRDLRICNHKLGKYGICFTETEAAVGKCIREGGI
jgi:dTDP-4-dehydrorhamnose reductase